MEEKQFINKPTVERKLKPIVAPRREGGNVVAELDFDDYLRGEN